MENSVRINKEVNVVAYYFKTAGQRLKGFPKKVEYEGKSIIFADNGLRQPTKKGAEIVHIFSMSDGQANYQLEFNAQNSSWKLLSIAT